MMKESPCPSQRRSSRRASWKRGLKARINAFSRVGCTRLVSNATARPASGSIQSEVPVYPRCPTLRGENRRLAEGSSPEGVSQPSVREQPGGCSTGVHAASSVGEDKKERCPVDG